MNLREAIIKSPTLNPDLVLYAKRIDGQLLPSSEAILLDLTEEEQEMKTHEVANRKCPGFSYCMEIFLIQEMMEDLDGLADKNDIDTRVDRVIHYIEYDA
ncbi:hypothetical protein [Chryseolinea soli]|uniref:Uncharacterized protein n=1 Tax=Chryseolinea soli TaxID=2321403 RepID=A0A385SXC7_9BACT|nr:hypothetical protein [Chryseolinea soli]AYB35604.1 hypothetical protein D4L85_18110 [Chryseolinea soli]